MLGTFGPRFLPARDGLPLKTAGANRRWSCVARLFVAVTLLYGVPSLRAADAPKAVKSPLSPAESLKAFRPAPELKIEIVAAEPEVVSPVSIAFDEEGRLWVVEMSDYPNGPAPGEPPKSRIKLLEDRDADGRFETAHIFADKLLFATGVQPWRGGVIVTLAGEIAYFKDTDGDNRADVRETWYRGFVQENPQLRANHPRFALDNHIYVANGLRGGTIVADKHKWGRAMEPVSISGKDFRFDPLTGECEAVSGNGQFGLTFDDFGNRFICSNRNPCRHVVLEDRHLKRNPYLAVRDVCQDVSPPAEKSRVFPISRAWTTSNLHAGQFTAACGVLIYRGDALPHEEYYGNSFVCEPTGNLVHRDVLEPDGSTFKSHYPQEGVEFLASPDEWFRPVDLASGPDGALYVVDMYRAVIEHAEWVPAELKNRPDLYDGSDRGRIYRIVSRSSTVNPARRGNLKMRAMSSAELAKRIEHANAWHRETGARLLFERQDKSIAADLEKIARTFSNSPAARVQAISLLEGLGSASEEFLVSLVADADERVRDGAVGAAESRVRSSPTLTEALVSERSGMSMQMALSLGEIPGNAGGLKKLASMVVERPDDEWLRHAVLSSVTNRRGLMAGIVNHPAYVASFPKLMKYRRFVEEFYEVVGAAGDERELNEGDIDWALKQAAPGWGRRDEGYLAAFSLAVVNGLGRGLARRGDSMRDALERFESRRSPNGMQTFFDDAICTASTARATIDMRCGAINVLQYLPFDRAHAVLMKLVQSDPLQEIRLAAVDSLAACDNTNVAASLVAALPAQTPTVRRRVLQALLRTTARAQALLGEIESGRLAVTELDPTHVQSLVNHKEATVRELARKLLAAAIPADRKLVLEKYQPALGMKGDPNRGRAVFEKNCVTCHKIGDLGVNVAPDISDSRTKTLAQLLTDILNPNQAIDNNYVSYTVLTKDGKSETGIVTTETAASITLRQPEGKTVLILRQEIDELKSNGISLMPEGLEKNITIEQMADLISFIKNWRYLDGTTPLGK
jgi:putative membrane-bound dehydrogenase-like protein